MQQRGRRIFFHVLYPVSLSQTSESFSLEVLVTAQSVVEHPDSFLSLRNNRIFRPTLTT